MGRRRHAGLRADELGWEPMAPPMAPSSYGLPSSNVGYFAVFGMLAMYAFIGFAGYSALAAGIAYVGAEAARSLGLGELPWR